MRSAYSSSPDGSTPFMSINSTVAVTVIAMIRLHFTSAQGSPADRKKATAESVEARGAVIGYATVDPQE